MESIQLRSLASNKFIVGLLLAAAIATGAEAATISRHWTYKTTLTGNTEFDTVSESEAAMHAIGPAESYLQYTGTDKNSDTTTRMQYAAVPNLDLPDDNEPWQYKACDWDLGHHECGPDTMNPPPPFFDEASAFAGLFQHGAYGCGIQGSAAPETDWWEGNPYEGAPTAIPAAPYQERQVRKYSVVRIITPSGQPSCSATDNRTIQMYRWRTLQCPAGYVKVRDEDTGQYRCENNKTAEVIRWNTGFCNNCQHLVGNPVNVALGAKVETVVDYEAPGIKFSRTFLSSMTSSANSTGHIRRLPRYWTHSYVRLLKLDPATDKPKELFRPNGYAVPVKALSGYTDVYVAQDASGIQVRPGAGAEEWDLFLNDGSYEHYESVSCDDGEDLYARPRLTYIEDAAGNQTTLTYPDTCFDSPSFVTGPFGHTIDITFATVDPFDDSYIEKVTDAAGQDIVFTYSDGNTGTLDAVTYQDGHSVQYHYEDTLPNNQWFLTGVTDEEGRRHSTFAYDHAGRAIATEHAGGDSRYTFAYDTGTWSSPRTVATDANGNQTSYFQAGYQWPSPRIGYVSRPGTADKQYTYEGSNQYRLTRLRNENNAYTYYYYDNFHRTAVVEPPVTGMTRRTDYYYLNDVSDLKTRTVRPSVCNDGITRFAEDEVVYAPGTQLVTNTISRGYRKLASGTCEPIERTVTFENHNAAGQPRLIDGPRSDVVDTTTISYYECTSGGQCGRIQSVTNALGHVTTFDSYDGHGRLLQSTDANDLITGYVYDARGRLLSITQTPPVGDSRVTSYTYEASGLVKTISFPTGLVITHDYNAAHRLTAISDNFGNHIDYGYDSRGNRTDEDVFDASEILKRAVDYAFDALDRLQTVNSGGYAANYTYFKTDLLKDETKANSAKTSYVYDGLYRLTKTTEPDLGYTDYQYDAADNLVYVRSPIFDITTYKYDDLGNQLQEVSPDRGTLNYEYDVAGNLTSETDARGKNTTHEYDVLNRLVLTTLDGGQTVAYGYDLNSNGLGRLSSIADSSGTTAWWYDPFGAVTQKQHTIGAGVLTTAYTYDAAGRVGTMTMPSGKLVSYGYSNHLPVSVSVDAQVVLSAATYDPFGPVSGWSWGDLTLSARTFDSRGLLTAQTLGGDTRTLAYDAVGQLTAIDDARHDLGLNYDLVGRLTNFSATAVPGGAVLPNAQAFSYDKNGNRLSLNQSGTNYTYSYPTTSGRLSGTTGPMAKSYSYDAAGNVTSDNIHSYGYDDRGRLTSVDSGSVTYAHNGQGQRVRKQAGAATTLFAYDEAGQLIGEYDPYGAAIQETVWFNGAPVAVLQGANHYHVHTDHLGTPRAISNGNTVIWRWESDPFGTTAAQEDPDGDMTDFTYNLRFPGQYYDSETGLHYNYFRDYDPSIGRYVQSDPIGLGGGANTYAYALNNPILRIDPRGLQTPALCLNPANAAACAAAGEISEGTAAAVAIAARKSAARAAAILLGYAAGREICKDTDTDCTKEVEECSELCAEAQADPDRKRFYGGSMTQCMKNCLPERCGGEPKWKGYK